VHADAILRDRVGQLRRRVRLLVTARWVCAALLAASLVGSLLVILDRLDWISSSSDTLWLLLGVGALAGMVIGLTRPVSLMDAAQLADRRLGLKERLSSGIDFLQRGPADAMMAAQLVDAVEHSQRVRPAEVFPFRLPREAKFFLGSLALLLALLFVPELSLFQSPTVRAQKAAIRKEGVRVEQLAKDYRKRDVARNSQIAKRIAANMQALGEEMRHGHLSKKQAMVRMAHLTKEMRDAQRQMALANTPRSLDQAADQLHQAAQAAPRQGMPPEAAKMMAAMAGALDKKDYQAAAQLLQQLAEKLQNGTMKPEEAKAAAAALSQMASALKGTSLDAAAKQMQTAAKQLAAASKLSGPQMKQAMKMAMQQAGKSCAQAGGT
jgi:hypothetical protein